MSQNTALMIQNSLLETGLWVMKCQYKCCVSFVNTSLHNITNQSMASTHEQQWCKMLE